MAPEKLDSLDADSLKPLVLRLLAQIEALLGYANEPELIHRTNLVLV